MVVPTLFLRRLPMRQLLAVVLGLSLLGGSSVAAQFQFQNDAYDKVERGSVVQTIGTTPQVVFSLPVQQYKLVACEGYITAVEQTWATGAVAKVDALFARRETTLAQVSVTRVDL